MMLKLLFILLINVYEQMFVIEFVNPSKCYYAWSEYIVSLTVL